MCVSLLLLVFAAAAEAQGIIFPDELDYAEGQPCPTRTGGPGICSRSCQQSSSLGEPPTCGITGSTFLVCCETTPDVSPVHQDISPPSNNFGCSDSFPHVIGTPTASGERITWPWMALVGSRNTEGGTSWHCAGMLITDQWVLSHADCFFQIRDRVVRLGEYDYNDDFDGAVPEDFNVEEIVFHPNYSRPQAYYDLVLVRLDSRVTLKGSISPVCLPWGAESKNSITGHKAKVLSYGNIIGGNAHNSVQKEVEVTVFPIAQCDRSYSELPQYSVNWPRGMGQETLCAGDPAGGRDACVGDSGGPLVSTDVLGTYVAAGIVSQGFGCGHKDYPGLYVNLRYTPYLAWIKEVAFATP